MNNFFEWKKYVKTSFLTMIVLIFCSYFYFWYDTVISYDINFKKEIDIPQELIMYKIDEIKQDSAYWDNPRLCCEIGTLYEKIYLFDMASRYYLRSVEIATKKYYVPHFKLAHLNMEREKFDEAIMVINLIPDVNNNDIKRQKGEFWENIAVKYAYKQRIDEALNAIKKAMIYYKSVDENLFNNAQKKQIYLLMEKAEQLVKNHEEQQAEEILEDAQKFNNSAEIAYRLGLLNNNNNDEKAYKYFEQVQNRKPSIINYDIYLELINRLAQKAKLEENFEQEKFYTKKAELLKKYVNNNIINQQDFVISSIETKMTNEFWGAKRNIIVSFDVYNNTKFSFRQLYAQVDIDINNNMVSKIIKLNDKDNILPFTTIKNIKTDTDVSKFADTKNVVKGKIYLYKNPKFNRIEAGNFEL